MDKNIRLKIAQFCIRRRVLVMGCIALFTAFFFYHASGIEVRTIFSDLMPGDHGYIKTHEEYKLQFGGANTVSIMLEVEEGEIFRTDLLTAVKDLTLELRTVTAINEFQITSLASKKLKTTKASSYGIEATPLMWTNVPETPEELEKLRISVLASPLAYGSYVSRDLKATLITADFIDSLVDYDVISKEINDMIGEYEIEGVKISVVGEPILRGLVNSFLPKTLTIFVISILSMGFILFVGFMRTWRGSLIPLVNAMVSAIWALGMGKLIGLNMDPLGVVIMFLITARVISHSVQSVTRFDEAIKESGGDGTSKIAAEATLYELWKPGILSVITDAGGIMVVALAPIPLLQKTAVLGGIWVSCIAVTGVIMTPVWLSWIRKPEKIAFPINIGPLFDRVLKWCTFTATGKARYALIGASVLIIVVGGYYASRIEVGDANPGTPLLWQDSEYNVASARINELFLGTDRMFVVVRGEKENVMKEPDLLQKINDFQHYIELQPEIGGSVALPDIIPAMNSVLHEGSPAYQTWGDNTGQNAELLYMYLTGSDPGDLASYCDQFYKDGAVTMYFRDHKGETIRTAISRIKRFIEDNPMEFANFELAGGYIGVLAAVNEVIFAGQIESIAFALLVVLITCSVTYRSGFAGLYFMLPIIISNVLTFNYMVAKGIGLNINTLPVAALGIGLGVDYAIYVMDALKEHYSRYKNLDDAVFFALRTAGRGVLNTATPLILCTGLWYFFSPMRFQAEMAILIAIWMGISAACALIYMPALVYVVRPAFLLGNGGSEK